MTNASQQSQLGTFGTNTDTDQWELPAPNLFRRYTVTGRVVKATDSKETAPQREKSPFPVTIHHYPIDQDHWGKHALFRICIGQKNSVHIDTEINHIEWFREALSQPDKTTEKIPGGYYTTSIGSAIDRQGRLAVSLGTCAIGDSNMLTIQIGDTLGAGATIEFTPSQSTDFRNVFYTLADAALTNLTETQSLPLDCYSVSESGAKTPL